MGCIQSSPRVEASNAPAREASERIDRELKVARDKLEKEVKMLLLGTGESGKSTILKQMQLIHGTGYSDETRSTFRDVIMSNIVTSLRAILEAMTERLGLQLGSPEAENAAAFIKDRERRFDSRSIPADAINAFKVLIEDSGVKAAMLRSNEFHINDSTQYYFENLDRILTPGYLPTDQDILRARVKTTGIVETIFHIEDMVYRMYDVGGQRSERKKWIHCFENVTAIVYMAALSEYDQKLFEDEKVNRMQESMQLFESICNSRWFMRTSMILFLNKIDLFKVKLKTSPLSNTFPNYRGGPSYEAACAFFHETFESLNRSEAKEVYIHLTCATDTTQIRFVMTAVRDIIMKNNLTDAGLL